MTKDELLEKLINLIKEGVAEIMKYNLPNNQDNPINQPCLLTNSDINELLNRFSGGGVNGI